MERLVSYGVLAPPNIFILLCTLAPILALRWRRIGISIMLVSIVCLFVSATAAFSSYVTTKLEATIPAEAQLSGAQAIVVLGADVYSERLGPMSLERIVMATDAYRRLGLPVLVSGGRLHASQNSVASLLKKTLKEYFGIPVRWVEDRSLTTYQQAVYITQMLKAANITTVLLVAQSRDLPRAIWSFQHVGLNALPWPAPRTALTANRLADFLPNTKALHETFYALHELIGGVYYRWKYRGEGQRL